MAYFLSLHRPIKSIGFIASCVATSKLIVWTLLLIWLLGSATNQCLAQSRLRQYTSKHYQVYTNLTNSDAKLFSHHMDRIFKEYKQRFTNTGFNTKDNRKLGLYLFRTRNDYLDFLDYQHIDGNNTGGIFAVTQKFQGLATYVQDRQISKTYAVLQHEGFHQFAFKYIGTKLPIWANEGIAQYFEDGVLVGRRFYLGITNPDRIRAIHLVLDQNWTIPFDTMINISDQDWSKILNRNREEGALLYDQAWSMVYYLIQGHSKKVSQAFENYLYLVSQGKNSINAFKKSFRTNNMKNFERTWRSFAKQFKPNAASQAVDRLRFLGGALQWLTEENHRLPKTLSELKYTLRRWQFISTQKYHGIPYNYRSADKNMYLYTASNGNQMNFKLLEPTRSGDPPRITAPGLKPEPTLVWYRQSGRKLMFDLTYR